MSPECDHTLMQLKEFSLISPVIESGEVLTALETAIPPAAIEQAIGHTEAREERNRSLPAHLVVCLVIGMSLWSSASMRTVLKNLVDGLSEAWVRVGQYWKVPCKSSITEARQRVGPRVMSQLFHQVVRPLATAQTPAALIGGVVVWWQWTEPYWMCQIALPMPECLATQGQDLVVGPLSQKYVWSCVIVAGTHLIFDALICPYHMGERVRALRLLRSVKAGMLLMWDRGLHSVCIGASDTGREM